jgi:hypothetical protein
MPIFLPGRVLHTDLGGDEFVIPQGFSRIASSPEDAFLQCAMWCGGDVIVVVELGAGEAETVAAMDGAYAVSRSKGVTLSRSNASPSEFADVSVLQCAQPKFLLEFVEGFATGRMCWFHEGPRDACEHHHVLTTWKNGRLHSDQDHPAVQVVGYGVLEEWRRDGLLHRDNGLPAVIIRRHALDLGKFVYFNPSTLGVPPEAVQVLFQCEWAHNSPHLDLKLLYRSGELHRDLDLPAVEDNDFGWRMWFRHGKLHRDDDQPAFRTIAGDSCLWAVDGKVHRDGDMPALVSPCVKMWFRENVKGRCHIGIPRTPEQT